MSIVVKLSPGERFLNWYAGNTKLYIRGERNADWEKAAALEKELWDAINPWLLELMSEARAEALERAAEYVSDQLSNRDCAVGYEIADEIRTLFNTKSDNKNETY
jgi:hypothetical protein